MHGLTRFALHHYPFHRARGTLLRRLPAVPPGAFRLRNGLQIGRVAGVDDWGAKALYWFGDYDPPSLRVIDALLRAGDTACDVGANIGAMSMRMALRVGDSGRVYAFEPVQATRTCLEVNLSANTLSQVRVCPFGLSSASGEATIHVPIGRPGMASITQNRRGDRSEVIRLEAFDAWASREGIDRVALCKIDTEGHEAEVFAGMQATLAAGRVESFLFEHSHSYDESVSEMLQSHGYRVWAMARSMRSVRLLGLGDKGYKLLPNVLAVRTGGPGEERVRSALHVT